MANVIKTGIKRFQTRLQMIDVFCFYLDVPFSTFEQTNWVTINSVSPDTARASVIAAGTGRSTLLSPIGDTTSTRDVIGTNTQIGAYLNNNYASSAVYYNNNDVHSVQSTGGTSTTYPALIYLRIYITTDDIWILKVNTLDVYSSDANNISFTLPTSSAYGYWVYSLPTFGLHMINIGGRGTLYKNISTDLHNAEIEIEEDPYANGGTTEEGGGSGDFDYTGDTIPEPSLPTIGAAATGFVSLFNPTTSQLQALSDYLWSPLFDLDTIKRLYADPMQQFIGLSLVPVPVPSAGTKTIQVGGVSTGIAINYVASNNQFVEVNCGSITFSSSSLTASYLDFLPYTKTQLYLPYIGIVDVSTDDIMDKTVSIKYHVDILTGGCIAYIFVNSSVMYQYSGQCAVNIPLSSIDWSTTISSALNLVSSAIGGIISGASVPLTGGAGALIGAQGVANMGASAVNAAVGMKPTVNKSGAIGGSSGIMAVQKPYLIVTCPNLARAKKQDYFLGYPSFINKTVANCSGFCSFEEIYLSGLGLTDSEMDELNAIMKEGVYL